MKLDKSLSIGFHYGRGHSLLSELAYGKRQLLEAAMAYRDSSRQIRQETGILSLNEILCSLIMNPLTLILVLSIAMGSIARGWTYHSPTSSALYQIGLVIRMHQDATGETIRNWEEFDRVWGSTNFKELEDLRMRERYAFVDWPHPSPGQSGTALLISRSPFKDTKRKQNWLGKRYKSLTEEGRWMLIKSDRGILPLWISEKRLQAWIVTAHLTLPTPDTVGRYPYESDYWMSVCANTAIGVAGVGCLTFSLARYVRGKKK